MCLKPIQRIILVTTLILLNISTNSLANDITTNKPQNIELTVEKILSKIEARYDVVGFQAKFYQEIKLNQIGEIDIARGRLLVLKPNNMRWDYDGPYHQTIIFTKKSILIFNPLEKQAIIGNPQFFTETGIDISFLSDITRIRKKFLVFLESPENTKKLYKLTLIPKVPSTNMAKITLHISKKNFDLVEVRVSTMYEDETVIKFEDIDLVSIPDDNLFELDFSEEVETLRLNN